MERTHEILDLLHLEDWEVPPLERRAEGPCALRLAIVSGRGGSQDGVCFIGKQPADKLAECEFDFETAQ